MSWVVIERCATGIPGFDNLCQGGLVRNSTNLLLGGPGSGKTTFLLQFLWNGVTKYNENGLYCSFEPDIVETLKDAISYGWDFSKLNEQDRIKFMRFSPHTSVDDLKSELTKVISKYDIKRICFDPVSVLTLNTDNDGKIREVLYEIASLMKRLRVTSILADESIESFQTNYHGKSVENSTDILRFLTDGVIHMHEFGLSGVGDRAVQISKMRRTKHVRVPVGMEVGDRGINILLESLSRMPDQEPVIPD